MDTRPPVVRHVVAWLALARAITCAALWLLLAVTWLLPRLELPLRTIAPLVLGAAICRTLVVLQARGSNMPDGWLRSVSLAFDALLLTGLLDITGGPFNPFIVIYGTYIWIAAVTLSLGWASVVVTTSIAAFGWLLFDHLQSGLLEHHRLNDLPTHLFTMWFAGAAVAELVAHYVTRARLALALRERQLEDARDRATRSERFAALTSLAASAAHELSTPLATIAVAARELERNVDRVRDRAADPESLKSDARLIRSEVDRCERILDGMSGRANAGLHGGVDPVTPASIAQTARDRLSESCRERLQIDIDDGTLVPATTGAEMVQAISSLLKNAFDASDDRSPVILRFRRRDGMTRIEVQDEGTGMSAETRRRAGEPFFTTKPTGEGVGLGLFLVRSFAERHDGTLNFEGEHGTTAVLEIRTSEREESFA